MLPARTTTFFCLLLAACATTPRVTEQASDHHVFAIQYAGLKGIPLAALVPGADPNQKIDTAFMVWLVGGGGHTVLVDAGFHRPEFFDSWHPVDFVSPEVAVRRAGVEPADVTDIVITHLHWDHAGGVDLFPNAHVWIQKDELEHYAAEAKEKPENAGVYAADIATLRERQRAGLLTEVDGDAQEILPGISVYTGGKHTFQSQYVGVSTTNGPVVLASDNVYLFDNLERHLPIAGALDADSNLRAQDRMRSLVRDPRLIIPGHDARVMTRFPRRAPGVVEIQ